jgi:hypothetical protein
VKDEPIPADQFARVQNEMRKLHLLVEEVAAGIVISKGLHKLEARRALTEASANLEVAQFWLGKAIHAAKEANDLTNE